MLAGMAAPKRSELKRNEGPAADGGGRQEPEAAAQRGAGSYVREWVNCGSPYCRACAPGGPGTHGPYWYFYAWRDGKHLKRYVGKSLPRSALRAPQEPAPPESPGRGLGETASG
jgi:hypothetical protein